MFSRCIYFNLSTLNRRITKLWESEFALIGLAPSHGYLLFAIAEKPKASQKELAEIMELDASTITRFIDALVRKNLITRERVGKGATYSMTDMGVAMVEKIQATMDTLFDQVRGQFGDKDFTQFVGSLRSVKDVLASAEKT
jgi:DNA-binding MarR family transcriptional regulator